MLTLRAQRAALSLTVMTLAAWHTGAHATADWTTAALGCAPGSLATLQYSQPSETGGYVASGRNPPLTYFCAVHNPDDAATTPSWKYLKLQFSDPNVVGGSIVARLYAKRRDTGAVTTVAEVASVPSNGVVTVGIALPGALSFRTNAYYVTIGLDAIQLPVQAHMVMLTSAW